MYNRIEITSYDSNSHGHNWKKKWFRYDTVLPGKSGKTSPLRSCSEGWINGISEKKQSNLSHGGFIKHFCPWNTMAIPISVDFLEAADLPSALASSDPSSLAPSCHPSASQNKFFVKSPSSRCLNLYVWWWWWWWWWWYLGLWWRTPNLA